MNEEACTLSAFAGYGVEIEYMIVDRKHLDVSPAADALLCALAGHPAAAVERGAMGWSNELALHVVELKNLCPVPTLEELPEAFHAEVGAANRLLADTGAQLMPGGMHPWMDPVTETRLWTHDNAAIYGAYDRIFDCRRHGWGNLQSVHLNLPFAGEEEFARLHAAIRLALPILPAIAASSPWADSRPSPHMDHRLAVYRDHQRQVPSSMGACIPEPCASPAEYHATVLAPMYREVAEYGTLPGIGDTSVLQHEWLDVRAAAPRFQRSAIEIRVLDAQECARADLAVVAATTALVRHLYEATAAPAQALETAALTQIFEDCIRDADRASITDRDYLRLFGLDGSPLTAGALWRRLIGLFGDDGLLAPRWLPPLSLILERGPLARRLEQALDKDPGRLRPVYGELCQCLRENRMYGEAA